MNRQIEENGPDVFTAVEDDAPLSATQHRLWLFEQLYPGSAAYNVSVAVSFDRQLSKRSLQQALDVIVGRHAALRTSIHVVHGNPRQRVAVRAPLRLETTETRQPGLSSIEAAINEEAMRPFDLSVAPLARATLIGEPDAGDVLVLTLHHIVSDGWSFEVLLEELAHAYSAAELHVAHKFGKAATQYTEFARKQRDAPSNRLESQRDYWAEVLANPRPALGLPLDRPRMESAQRRGRRVTLPIGQGVSDAAIAVGRQHRASPFMTFLAVYSAVLHRWAGAEDVIIGTAVSGRTDPSFKDTVGFFVNTLPLRVDLSGNPTFSELLARIRTVQLGAYARQDVRLDELVQLLAPERHLDRTPFFDVMFNFINRPTDPPKLGDATGTFLQVTHFAPQCDLTVQIQQERSGYSLTVEYDTDLFDESTLAWFMNAFEQMLRNVETSVHLPLSELSTPRMPNRSESKQHQPSRVVEGLQTSTVEADEAEPRSSTEQAVADIWRDLLNRTDIRADQSFFAVGGYSLLVIKVIKRINERFNVSLTNREVFRSPTIREIAGAIDAAASAGPGSRA